MDSRQKVIGIRREQKNKWERRCSLTPKEVKQLVDDGIKVIVQPSPNRCYSDEEFLEAGAVIQDDLTECDVIFGVKEVPIDQLIEGKTYFFFSHVIKAQEYNMPLLDAMLEKRITQIDFECIREDKETNAQRLVAFGRYAGIAGAFDFLRGVGEYLLQKGHQTPFIFLGSSYMYEDYEAMCNALSKVSKNISKSGLPKDYSPLVFAVTGTGRVAQGIIEVLEQLPHDKVDPDDLESYQATNNKKVVISQFQARHLVRHKDGKDFDKADYYANPSNYESKFYEYLPYVHFLMNGIYWESKYPRVITTEELREAMEEERSKLLGVCDISADYQGSIEFTKRFTSIEEPFLVYNVKQDDFREKIAQANNDCILFHCVDHLPAEMPKEASNHFGEKLFPFVKAVVYFDQSKPFEEINDLPNEIKKAIVVHQGKLTPEFDYITDLRTYNEQNKKRQEDYMKGLEDMQLEPSPIRRGISFATVVFHGHLFDTKFFNICIDILEQAHINFRIIEWEVGTRQDHESSVTLQLLAPNHAKLDQALDAVNAQAQKLGVKLQEGQGPSFSDNVIRLIHQDRVR